VSSARGALGFAIVGPGAVAAEAIGGGGAAKDLLNAAGASATGAGGDAVTSSVALVALAAGAPSFLANAVSAVAPVGASRRLSVHAPTRARRGRPTKARRTEVRMGLLERFSLLRGTSDEDLLTRRFFASDRW
jgi:hypothetical protein